MPARLNFIGRQAEASRAPIPQAAGGMTRERPIISSYLPAEHARNGRRLADSAGIPIDTPEPSYSLDHLDPYIASYQWRQRENTVNILPHGSVSLLMKMGIWRTSSGLPSLPSLFPNRQNRRTRWDSARMHCTWKHSKQATGSVIF